MTDEELDNVPAPLRGPLAAAEAPPPPPRYCEACGAPLPELADLNLPAIDPADRCDEITLTRDQAMRFRAAYLSLFTFWLTHNSRKQLKIEDASLAKVGL